MEGLRWILENGFTLLSAVGIVGSLLFTALTRRDETRTRRISNLIAITSNHRELWQWFSENPKLKRVLDPLADITKEPVALEEREFVNMVILHASSAHYAVRDKLVTSLEGLQKDLCQFFSLPIPKAVWEQSKALQNDDFLEFVEQCLNGK
jgi:hypothetical protein